MRPALAVVAVVAVAAAISALAAPAAGGDGPSPAAVRGTYRVAGTVRVEAGPALSRTLEGRADAVLRPGSGPRALRARLASQGYACELDATLEEGGGLAFPPGQRCLLELRDPGARGRVEARLRAGRGSARGGRLALDLTFELSGAVSLQTAGAVEVLGKTVQLPEAWTPELPVRGEARAAGDGARDESKAADR